MKASNSITITEINDGLGVSSVIVEYYKSTSPMQTIGGTWSETVPERENGTFLWTRTTYVMSDGTTRSSGEACISGYDGTIGHDGVGISSIVDYYQVSPSNEVAPSTWVTDPSLVEMDDTNRYLWNYTVISYDNGTSQTTDAKVIGAHGADGYNGQNAQTYEIVLSGNVFKVSDTGTIAPATITCSFYHRDGSEEREPYAGRYRIVGYDSSGAAITTTTATSNVTSVDITPNNSVSYYQVTLYQEGGTTVFLDSQTIPVLTDPAAYTVYLDNENHTFAGGISAATAGQTVTVNVIAYRGTTRVATTIGTLPTITGLNTSISQNGDTNTSITFTTTSALSTAGVVSIPITVDGLSFEKDFSYSVAFKGETGTAARIHYLQLSTDAIKVSDKGVISPSSVTVEACYKVGSSATKTEYTGRIQVTGYTSSGFSQTIVTPSSDRSSASFNPGTTFSYYIVTLYASGGTTTVLDRQTIPVLTDEVAYTVFLDNENHTFAGTTTAAIQTTLPVTIYAYKGRTRMTPSNVTMSGFPTGMSASWSSGGNTVTFNVTNQMTSPSGVVNLAITVDGIVFNKTFSYSIAFAGEDGSGVSIESTDIEYQASTNGTTPPTGTWSTTIPTLSDGQFLWTRTTVTYSDSNTSVSYSVGYKGTDGTDGTDGQDGKDGKDGESITISSTSVRYQTSSSGTTTPTGTWQSTVPSVTLGDYLWTRTIVTYSDGTSTTSYSVGRFGTDGENGIDGSSNYVHIAYATSSTGADFSTTWFSGATYLGIFTDENKADSTTPSDYSWSLIKGADGSSISITSNEVRYQYSTSGTTVPTGTWSSTVPTTQSGKYLWTRTTTLYSDSSSSTSYSVGYIGVNGENGTNGQDGTSITISSTSVRYQTSSSGTITPTGAWQTTIPEVTLGDYLWTRTIVTYSDGTSTTSYSVGRFGTDGENGIDGSSNYVHIAYATSSSGADFSTTWFSGATYLGVFTDENKADSTRPSDYSWSLIKGADGSSVSITSNQIRYQYSTSGTTVPTGTWSSSVPATQSGKYLWTRTITSYSDGSSSTSYSVGYIGVNGENGTDGQDGTSISISSTSIRYATSSNGTTAPSSGWGTTIPDVTLGNYLWTRTIVTYSDGTSTTSYSVGRFGADGEDGIDGSSNYIHLAYATSESGADFSTTWFSGATYLGVFTDGNQADSTTPSDYSWSLIKGADGTSVSVSSNQIRYQYSTSGTTVPTGTWSSSVPATQSGKYLWTRTVTTYSDGSSSTSYSVGYIGTNGENGTNGTNGQDGTSITISSTSVMYATSSSGTTAPTSGWNTTIPSVTLGDYLWTRTSVTYSDNTTTTAYSVTRFGTDGTNGTAGADSYVHIAYATSATGQENFSTTWFSAATYVGILTNHTENDSTRYQDYAWSLMKGADGTDGVSMTSMVQHYQVSNSNTTAPTTWVDDPSQVTMTTSNKYLWSYSTVSYSNNTSEDTDPVVIGVYGNTGTAARIYMVMTSADAVTVAKDGTTVSPTSITVNTYYKNGTSTTKTNYNGRIQVIGYKSDGTSQTIIESTTNEHTRSFSPSAEFVYYTVTLHAAGGITTNSALDSQTIPVIKDGTDGTSATAYTVYLTNEAHTFPGTDTAAINSNTTTRVIAYKDTTQIPVRIGTITGTVTGLTATIQSNNSVNASVLISATPSLTTQSGVLTIPITADGQSFTKQFSWSVAFMGVNGTNGRGVASFTPQYYLSTSDETTTGGEWTTTQPQWQQGYYIWTRMEIIYTDSETPVYTSEYCDDSLNQVITYVDENDKDLQDQISDQAAVIVDSETRITAIEEQTSSFVQTMEEIKSTVTTIGKDVNDMPTTISNMISHTSNEIALIKETTNENSKLREYITVDGSKMTFGSSDSGVTLELDNDELAFKSGDTAVAYMSDQRMFITDATVDNELQIGGKWSLYIRSNDHLTLKWIG